MLYSNTKTINKIIVFSLLIFSFSLIFVVLRYMGVVSLISKIINSLTPVFIAIFVSFLLEPIIMFFFKKGIKRKYSVLLVFFFFFGFIVLILYFTIPSLIEQINVFISNIPRLVSIGVDFINKIGLSFDETKLNESISGIVVSVSKSIIDYLSSSIRLLFDILLGVSGAVFLSFDFPEFCKRAKSVVPNKIKGPVIYYFENIFPLIYKYFVGMLLDSILIFIICIIGFSIIGIEYNLVISLFIAITNLIPIIGPYIGGIPAVLVGFSISSTLGISAFVVVVLVQLVESSFIQPLILKNAIKLHPLEGILGISLFGALFGIIGMILSPILVVAVKLLFIPYNRKDEVYAN